MSKFNISAIIFDMDGTLVDSEQIIFKLRPQINKALNIQLKEKHLVDCIGHTKEYAEEYLKANLGPNFSYKAYIETVSHFLDEILEKKDIPLKPGAFDLLQSLKKSSVPLGLATSTERVDAIRVLHATELYDFFDVIVCSTEAGDPKPAPDIYLYTAEQLNNKTNEIVVFEDSITGTEAALNAGIKTIIVPDIVKPLAQQQKRAAAVLPSLIEGRRWLEEHTNIFYQKEYSC